MIFYIYVKFLHFGLVCFGHEQGPAPSAERGKEKPIGEASTRSTQNRKEDSGWER